MSKCYLVARVLHPATRRPSSYFNYRYAGRSFPERVRDLRRCRNTMLPFLRDCHTYSGASKKWPGAQVLGVAFEHVQLRIRVPELRPRARGVPHEVASALRDSSRCVQIDGGRVERPLHHHGDRRLDRNCRGPQRGRYDEGAANDRWHRNGEITNNVCPHRKSARSYKGASQLTLFRARDVQAPRFSPSANVRSISLVSVVGALQL